MAPKLRCSPLLVAIRRSALALVAVGVPGCSSSAGSTGKAGPLDPCDEIDVSDPGQATVKAFAEAALALQQRADDLEGRFGKACSAMDAELHLDTSSTSTGTACAVLRARVKDAVATGATVALQIVGNCVTDIDAHAPCEDECQQSASCDLSAHCTGGEVVVACDGACSGPCDVQAPDTACAGSCAGSCTAVADFDCKGLCQGNCDAAQFEGSCTAGCAAGFSGTCDGTCTGSCDGLPTTGSCNGACQGACQGVAVGVCGAVCSAGFEGVCTGLCSGSCSAASGVTCPSPCIGTCTDLPAAALCHGECHGDCASPTSPPVCTGQIDCAGAGCYEACQAKAKASVDCSKPAVAVLVEGDLELERVMLAHQQEWAELVSLTQALYDPIQSLGAEALSAIPSAGYVVAKEQACFVATLGVVAESVISINSSNQVSSSLQGAAN